jgi:hypothetical protein
MLFPSVTELKTDELLGVEGDPQSAKPSRNERISHGVLRGPQIAGSSIHQLTIN